MCRSDKQGKGIKTNMRKVLLVLTTSILLVFSAVSLAVPDGSPEAPADLAVAVGDGRVMLSWTTPDDNGSAIIRYEYHVSDDGGTSWNPDWTEVLSSDASTTGHEVDSLTNGTVYTFGVRAVNVNGAGASAEVNAIPGFIEPLAATGCTDGTYVNNPDSSTALVSDCESLVAVRNHWTNLSANAGLPATHPLRTWGSGNSTIDSWEGVSVSGQLVTGQVPGGLSWGGVPTTSLRVTRLDLRVAENVTAGRVSGTLPTQLGNLTGLKHLHLSNNQLTGSIPEELGDLADLNHLHLNGNELTGPIPEELWKISSLMFLNLGNNGLTGSIPEELEYLANLRHLHLNGNELTGPIPEELWKISSLMFLNLGNNGLTGSIPEELEYLANLRHLHLNDNKLTGSIPEELRDITTLRSLYLNDNGLTGSIPEELGDLTSLRRLFLNDNELRGLIPEELGELTNLRQLFLNDNQLSGSVPEELGELSPSQYGNLIRLYICRNMLSVTLPTDLRNLGSDASTCVAAPSGLGAAAGDGQVTLSWTDPGNEGITGYEYRVCEAGGANCGAWTRIEGSGASTASYVEDGLENGRDYLFQLRAVNRSGPGMSAEVAARAGLPKPLTVDAGPDQTVGEGEAVTLSGSVTGTENREFTYLWEQAGGTPAVTLSGADTATASFTAPSQIISDAALVFRLTVSDGDKSVADTVTVTVTAGTNDAPLADAGDDQTVDEGAAVTLDGSGSSDPEGETLTYVWTKTSGPTVTLSSSTAESPTFMAPRRLASDVVFVFSLVVTDARGLASSADTVKVTVRKAPPPPPKPKLVLSKTSMLVTDGGSSSSLKVRLATRPAGTVTIVVAFVSSGEDDATLSTNSLTFTTSNWNINQTITVTGRDDGGSSSQTANFTLNPSGANYNSVATVTVSVAVSRVDKKASCPDIEDKSATVGTAFSFTPPVGTGGDAPLRYSASGTGSGISFNSSTRVFSGTPTREGTLNITYTVTDSDGDSCSETFSIVIAAKVPAAPTGVKITRLEGDYFHASWNSVEGATYYRYSYIYTNGEGDPESGWGRTTSTSFRGVFQNGYDGDLSVGVSACNDSGCSIFSSAS